MLGGGYTIDGLAYKNTSQDWTGRLNSLEIKIQRVGLGGERPEFRREQEGIASQRTRLSRGISAVGSRTNITVINSITKN